MAGAGVSAGNPSALPGWNALNSAIIRALRGRLESALGRPNWLIHLDSFLEAERTANRFPPEYQAQLIEEMSGERYFRALQALDVEEINSAHDGIATLAAAGALRAVVTTNFDCLIERALQARSVRYDVGFDGPGFVTMEARLRNEQEVPLQVIKIHGSVEAHLSMIDTLKQRKLGRSRSLQACLNTLQPGYWLFLGFSAADLEGDEHYLGLISGAARGIGATYITRPKQPNPSGPPKLSKGAELLMQAYGDRGEVVVADIAVYLADVCSAIGAPKPTVIAGDEQLGLARFHEKLGMWADNLSASSAGLCLAAALEAVGDAESAVRILDRLVRKELYDERESADFRALQLHYGRLGGAWGRFVAVPDIGGAASNASVETVQSLARILNTELGFAASSWLPIVWLWLSNGDTATRSATALMAGFVNGVWNNSAPRTDEEAVDAWVSAVQVFVVNNGKMIGFVLDTGDDVLKRARRSGDVVRVARAIAMRLLALSQTNADVPSEASQYESEFAEAERVGDGFALGMRSLALGRWHVGPAGLALGRATDSEVVATRALEHLQHAVAAFQRQGMDPWVMYAVVQQAKAQADLHQFDEAHASLELVMTGIQRFPIWASHVHEAVGQAKAMRGDADAAESFHLAVKAADACGLLARRELLLEYLNAPP